MSDDSISAAHAAPPGQTDDQRLIDYLRERDADCPQCGYNLRNLHSPRCPECGQALRLSVTLVEPYLKAWITLLVSMCAGGGLGVLWALIIPIKGGPSGPVILAVIIHILMIPVVPLVIMKRRRFLKQSREVQWKWAALGGAFFVLSIIIFVVGA